MFEENHLVVITSPNLYMQTKNILREHFKKASIIMWELGDAEKKKDIRNFLISKKYKTCISIYNDYIFSEEEINNIQTIVNIHPALPHIRGRGYDILPLIYKHRSHGVTLHFVNKTIDSGPIIRVLINKIKTSINYQEFRRSNQELSLEMLNYVLNLCHNNTHETLRKNLKGIAALEPHVWEGRFVNSLKLSNLLSDFFRENPNHPLLIQVSHLFTLHPN